MDISARNQLSASNHLRALIAFDFGLVLKACCTYSDAQFGAGRIDFCFFRATLFAREKCALGHAHMLIIMCVLLALQREDYCRFTRSGNNEQAHPRDMCSISITMKHC